MRRSITTLIGIFIAMAAATGVQAKKHYAVLVGVGRYEHLPKELHLNGPPNDVRLMRKYLITEEKFPKEHIISLTDGGDILPMRAEIITALETLGERLAAGDFALLYFSGHGSRQPAKVGDVEELDGYDEIFLPADVRGWDKKIGSVENAITDDEIGAYISSYRRKGADIWLIFDSCHSGTMTRGVGDDAVRTRKIPETALDIPERPARNRSGTEMGVQTPTFADGSLEAARGILVSFSAAHTSEEAPEMKLPKGSQQQEDRGLLTHSIFTVLSRFPGISYRQLAQLVTDQYLSLPWMRSKPQFYGTDMNRVVFNGAENRVSLFRGRIAASDSTRLTMSAGAVRGFDKGAGIAVFRDASGTEDSLLGTGEVVTAAATDAVVKVEWRQGVKIPTIHSPVYIRLVHPAYEPRVLISQLNTVKKADNQRLQEIVASLESRVPLVRFSDYDKDADYFAAFHDEKFWLLRPGQSLPCSVQDISVTKRAECERNRSPQYIFWSTETDAERLVSRAARARSLTKLQGVIGLPDALSLSVQIQKSGAEAPMFLDEHVGPLRAGDKLYYSVHNRGRTAWDVFLFHVDSQLGIQALQEPGHSARVLDREKIDTRFLGTINDETKGAESLVIIAEPVRDGVEPDYYFLAQDSWTQTRTRGRGGGGKSPLETMLERISVDPIGARSRGLTASAGATGAQGQIKVFTWSVE